jgi:hypothetical protein
LVVTVLHSLAGDGVSTDFLVMVAMTDMAGSIGVFSFRGFVLPEESETVLEGYYPVY